MSEGKQDSVELVFESQASAQNLWDGEVFVSIPHVYRNGGGVPTVDVVVGTNHNEDDEDTLIVGGSMSCRFCDILGKRPELHLRVRLLSLTLNEDSTFVARLSVLRQDKPGF